MNSKITRAIIVFLFCLSSAWAQSRSASALGDICARYPSFKSCSGVKKDTIAVANVPQSNPPQQNMLPPNPINQPPKPVNFEPTKNDSYCNSNKNQFLSTCDNQFTATSDAKFCSDYGTMCRGWRRINTVQKFGGNGPPQTVNQNTQRQPPTNQVQTNTRLSESDVVYCQTYGKDYYNLCVNGPVEDIATTFCSGFSQTCPGVPAPGGNGIADSRRPVGPAQNNVPQRANDAEYCNAYGKNYYALCLNGPVQDIATTFCNGFSRACPGVPRPSTTV